MFMIHGLFGLPVWAAFVIAPVFIHLTIVSVTLFLHRDQTHRGLELHPAVRHVFRFWLWLTTGMVTREWVAVHRKHHACCETKDDPHSPRVKGLLKVLLEGAELYRAEAAHPETIAQYGRGTVDDWMERHLYSRHSQLGIGLLLVVDLLLLGLPGITLWAVQMLAIPVLAAGVVNGVGHYAGYRNFECKDAATNVVPWGIIIGGEELHNNHHAFPSSAKFSQQPWEFDLGWSYIRMLEKLRLVKVRRVAPEPVIVARHGPVSVDTVQAVIVNRMHVLRKYIREVIRPAVETERQNAGLEGRGWLAHARRLLTRDETLLDARGRTRLQETLARSPRLRTVYEFRRRLQALWENNTLSNESLLQQFKDWCAQAENAHIATLREFAQRLRGFTLRPV
ncbi:MAG TPA: fatty acid desaturase [Gammaproteobacteria bacterium]|nr:fatty acid desaturase [Gammaproteobacteria bacterium]